METKDLTIVIKNIPKEALEDLWCGCIKRASKIDGTVIESMDIISMDFNSGLLSDKISDVLAGSIAYHCAVTHVNELLKEPK